VLKDKITNPLEYFDHNNKSGATYKTLRERLFKLLPQMGGFPPNKNGKIEKVFQLPQTKPRPRPYTHNTPNDQSIKKPYLNVLLLGILISQGYNEIQEIYTMINFT